MLAPEERGKSAFIFPFFAQARKPANWMKPTHTEANLPLHSTDSSAIFWNIPIEAWK